jgi:hypothetical protein
MREVTEEKRAKYYKTLNRVIDHNTCKIEDLLQCVKEN